MNAVTRPSLFEAQLMRETVAADTRMVQPMTLAAVQRPIEGELPSLDSVTAWLNVLFVHSILKFFVLDGLSS